MDGIKKCIVELGKWYNNCANRAGNKVTVPLYVHTNFEIEDVAGLNPMVYRTS